MAIAIMKIVDIAIIRAVARCPCPERSAGRNNKKNFHKGVSFRMREQLTVRSLLCTYIYILIYLI